MFTLHYMLTSTLHNFYCIFWFAMKCIHSKYYHNQISLRYFRYMNKKKRKSPIFPRLKFICIQKKLVTYPIKSVVQTERYALTILKCLEKCLNSRLRLSDMWCCILVILLGTVRVLVLLS